MTKGPPAALYQPFVDACLLRGLAHLEAGRVDRALEDFQLADTYPENLQEIKDRKLHYVVATRQSERDTWLDDFQDQEGFEEIVRVPSPLNPFQKKGPGNTSGESRTTSGTGAEPPISLTTHPADG